MKQGRSPVIENRLRCLSKVFEYTENLKNRSHCCRPKLSAEPAE